MTRILADLPDEAIQWLDARATEVGKSRAAVLRDAVSAYMARSTAGERNGIERYFGLWARHGSNVDGLEYERNLRGEWPETGAMKPSEERPDPA